MSSDIGINKPMAYLDKLVPLDEFDAICDEFLKAFEVIDVAGQGVVSEKEFLALQALVAGENILQLPGRMRASAIGAVGVQQRSITLAARSRHLATVSSIVDGKVQDATVEQLAAINKGYRGGTVTRVIQSITGEPISLSPVARRLFESKRRELLNLSFQQIQMSESGALAADELLSAIGLSGPKAFAAEVAGLSADVFGCLWPNMVDGESLPEEQDQLAVTQCDFNKALHRTLEEFVETQLKTSERELNPV